jgi:hypothetical protein
MTYHLGYLESWSTRIMRTTETEFTGWESDGGKFKVAGGERHPCATRRRGCAGTPAGTETPSGSVEIAAHTDLRLAVEAPSGGLSTRLLSASDHYTRRACGRCLTRARQLSGGVSKLGKTESETQRTAAEMVWNRGRFGGPTVAGSKRRDGRRRKFPERLWPHARVEQSANGQANQWSERVRLLRQDSNPQPSG